MIVVPCSLICVTLVIMKNIICNYYIGCFLWLLARESYVRLRSCVCVWGGGGGVRVSMVCVWGGGGGLRVD